MKKMRPFLFVAILLFWYDFPNYMQRYSKGGCN